MGFFSPDSKFSQIMGMVFDLLVLAVLWFVCSLTIVGIGPAATASYYAMAKSIRHGRGQPWKEFFHGLKASWKPSLAAGLLLTLLGAGILLLDGYALIAALVERQIAEPVRFVLALCEVCLLLGISIYIFPVLSRFEVRIWNAILLSITLMFRNIWRTLYMVAILAAAILLLIGVPELFWLIPTAYLCFLTVPMERILVSYLKSCGIFPVTGEDLWYLEDGTGQENHGI